jgi:amidase
MRADEYIHHDAVGLAELVRDGEVQPKDLIAAAISRIETFNPRINAVIHKLYDRANAAVTDLPEGPLRGVPFLIKDLLAHMSGVPTTGGSRYLRNFVPDHDTELISRYRAAGLVFLGKTSLPEFGLMGVTEPELWGTTHNPWDLARTPGGSSGGAAAAVAARFVPAAHAADGGGSIRIPASACGLFGLKPSRGRVPLGPVLGDSWMGLVQEHAITRTVRDSAALLDAVDGSDVGAPYAAPAKSRPFAEEVRTDPPKLRIAFTDRALFGNDSHPDCTAAVRDAAELLEGLGHDVSESTPDYDKRGLTLAYLRIVASSVAADLSHYEQATGRKPTPDQFEIETWMMALIGRKTPASVLASDLALIGRATRGIGRFFENYDLLLTPTLAHPPVLIGELASSQSDRNAMKALMRLPVRKLLDKALDQLAAEALNATPNTMLFNETGQPAASIPLFWSQSGLPIGVQAVAGFGREDLLFRVAGQLERARPWSDRLPPGFGEPPATSG